jgi:N utilization substance protein B
MGLVRAYWSDRQRIDDRITKVATTWDLERMSPVERNAIRVALVEMTSTEIPPKVSITEAIEIGKEYAGAGSPKFINGGLDAAYRGLREEMGEDT